MTRALDPCLDTRAAAAYVGAKSPEGFHKTAVRRGLEHERYGRKRMYRVSTLDRFLASERRQREAGIPVSTHTHDAGGR